MSRAPRVVAELGRPETPQETADRKAESTRKHYANQTFTNLMLATAASLILVVVIVLVVLRPASPEPDPIDYTAIAQEAERQLGTTAIAPKVPEDWRANAAEIRMSTGDIVTWYTGFITPQTDGSPQEFLSITQAINADPTWLATKLEDKSATGETTIDGIDWTIIDRRDDSNAGNLEYSMSTVVGTSTVVLAGTGDDAQFATFAAAVSDELAAIPSTSP